jgi:hypothetical protein
MLLGIGANAHQANLDERLARSVKVVAGLATSVVCTLIMRFSRLGGSGGPPRWARPLPQTARLENRCTGNRTVGSNPTLSRHISQKSATF